jgi:hypothetical protein
VRRYRKRFKQSSLVEARAAVNMIREIVEMHAPARSIPNMEYMLSDIAIEAEVIAKGIYPMVGKGKEPDAAEIIKRPHNSDINGGVSWFFDGLWEWRIGDALNGWKLEGKADDAESALRDLAENAFAHFPRSEFAKWWATPR